MPKARSQTELMRLLAFLIVFLTMASCNIPPQADISISQAVVKRPLAGKAKTVAYFELDNNTGETKVLLEIRSEIAGAIEIHRTIKTGALMRMQRLGELAIPAFSSVSFSPGGNHLMLFRVGNLSNDLANLEFHFSDGSSYVLEFVIEDY